MRTPLHLLQCLYHPLEQWLKPYAHGNTERQRLTVFVYATIMIIIAAPVDIFGLAGYEGPYIPLIDIAWLVLGILNAILLFGRKLSVNAALLSQTYLSFACVIVTMITCAMQHDNALALILMGDMCISITLIMLTIIAHYRRLPYFLSFVMLTAYGICCLILPDKALTSMYSMLAMMLMLVCFLGTQLLVNISHLQAENLTLRNEEETLLRMMGINKDKMLALMELSANGQLQGGKAVDLLSLVGDHTKERVYRIVSDYMKEKALQTEQLAQIFPELTASQLDIARLILQGKKQADICSQLNKSKGNITSQRTHIRAKLGLEPNDDLREKLQERLDAATRTC